MEREELESKFGRGVARLARFPPGEALLPEMPFRGELLAEVDRLLAAGHCPEGRFELATDETRLTCFVHRSAPFLAGLLERDVFSRVPLYDFILRARQLSSPTATLTRTEPAQVLMEAVHYCQRPELQGPTRLVDPEHVLRYLAKERQDAALAFERGGARTLLFLNKGQPAQLYFGRPEDDPREGSLEERVLLYAFAPGGPACRVEVYTRLDVEADRDAGRSLVELAEAAKPPPPADVIVTMPDGRELRRRPFTPPEMIIGRDPTVDLFIDNLAVSRKHARLFWERGAFAVADLDSANGTLVNGKPVERAVLETGDRIEVGKFRLDIFEHPAAPSVSETVLLRRTGLVAGGYLVGDGVAEPVEKDLLIGKGDGVDVRAEGWFVRPVHARLKAQESGGFRLVCFGSGRARVNGEKVRDSELSLGDEIVIGRTRFRMRGTRPKGG